MKKRLTNPTKDGEKGDKSNKRQRKDKSLQQSPLKKSNQSEMQAVVVSDEDEIQSYSQRVYNVENKDRNRRTTREQNERLKI